MDATFRTEQRSDRWAVLLGRGGTPIREVTFETAYEPACTIVDDTAVCWSANEIAAVDLKSFNEHRVRCREFIQTVIPIAGERMWVVCDTYASVFDIRTWNEQIVLEHDEIFADTKWDGRTLTLKDLDGNLMRVSPPVTDDQLAAP